VDRASSADVEWAHEYDGYSRLASTPEQLEKLLRSARNSYRTHGRVPSWCGVDLLRGWAFLLVRADHHSGGGTLDGEWLTVLDALRHHPHARHEDRPPAAAPARATGLKLPSRFSIRPRMHRDHEFLEAKQQRLWEPHVAPINEFVNQIRSEIAERVRCEHRGGLADHVHVPYIDPDSGGVAAKVLFVLESPARTAALGSSMLSADNDDPTAANVWEAYDASGLPRIHGLHWNAVPWFVGTEERNAGVSGDQVELGRTYLRRLIALAPDVRVILAMGKPAAQTVAPLAGELERAGIAVRSVIHPSPRNYNSRPGSREAVILAFSDSLRLAEA